jgi:hypothetical protein
LQVATEDVIRVPALHFDDDDAQVGAITKKSG